MNRILGIALAGAIGTLARYWLAGLVQKHAGSSFPWGTVMVNLLGCFLFGVVWAMSEERMLISGQWRIVILVGFMGAFTTFSTFIFESANLMRTSEWLMAVGNMTLQNIAGIALLMLGLALGRAF